MKNEEEYNNLDEYEKSIVDEYWEEISPEESITNILDFHVFTGTPKEFIDDYLESTGIDIPDWVWIDYEKTWEFALAYDYVATSNYIFSTY